MKKIAILLSIIFFDLILLQSAAAFHEQSIIPGSLFPYVLLFLTLIITLFLFYEEHMENLHQRWHNLYTNKVDAIFQHIDTSNPKDALVKSLHLRRQETPSLVLQYQQVEMLITSIRQLRTEGRSEEEIIAMLKEQRWDPHVIYLALARAK